MIATPCSNCCFFKNNKCEHDQFYISTPKTTFAPGFCRLYRNKKWAENKKDLSLVQLKQRARKESELMYDLVIIHSNDDYLNTLENNLAYCSCPTLSSTNKFNNPLKQIIIADVTLKKDRSQIINLFKTYKGPKKLDVLVDGIEEKLQETIKRISNLITQKYFIVIPSSKILNGRDNEVMMNEINNRDTRFIYWPFVSKLAQTIILPLQPIYGLYIKNSYDKLTEPTEIQKTFYENLKEEEISTGIQLCCPVDIII